MKRIQHSQEQIRIKLREAARMKQAGRGYTEIVNALGISSATYSRWRNEFPQWFKHDGNGFAGNGSERVTRLEQENSRLKLAFADIFLRERGILPAH